MDLEYPLNDSDWGERQPGPLPFSEHGAARLVAGLFEWLHAWQQEPARSCDRRPCPLRIHGSRCTRRTPASRPPPATGIASKPLPGPAPPLQR